MTPADPNVAALSGVTALALHPTVNDLIEPASGNPRAAYSGNVVAKATAQ